MPSHSPHADLGIFRIDAAEHHQTLGMFANQRPTVLVFPDELNEIRSENMGNNCLCRCNTVGTKRRHVTPDGIEESVQLALCMMKPPGTSPSVGTAKYRAISVISSNTLTLLGNEI